MDDTATFFTRIGSDNLIIAASDAFGSSGWSILDPISWNLQPVLLDSATLKLGRIHLNSGLTTNSIITYFLGAVLPGTSNMYITNVQPVLLGGSFWEVQLSAQGIASKKFVELSQSISIKEISWSRGGTDYGYNAPVPSYSLKYLRGPSAAPQMPPSLPSPPPAWAFYGPAKYNSPSGFVLMSFTPVTIYGTPYTIITEEYQWIYAAEPAEENNA